MVGGRRIPGVLLSHYQRVTVISILPRVAGNTRYSGAYSLKVFLLKVLYLSSSVLLICAGIFLFVCFNII